MGHWPRLEARRASFPYVLTCQIELQLQFEATEQFDHILAPLISDFEQSSAGKGVPQAWTAPLC